MSLQTQQGWVLQREKLCLSHRSTHVSPTPVVLIGGVRFPDRDGQLFFLQIAVTLYQA